MWFRFVLALSAIAVLGLAWTLFGPDHGAPPAATGKPGTVQTR